METVSITITETPQIVEVEVQEIAAGPQGIQGPKGDTLFLTENIQVIALADESPVNHSLNSTKIAVFFYDVSGREVKNISWEPVTTTNIKIYLPLADGTAVPFTGDIFIINRN